jgi:hypothetical protein
LRWPQIEIKAVNEKEFVAMRRVMNLVVFAALLAGSTLTVSPLYARAAGYDGNWSVLIITEKGDCDRAYRYGIKVANGRVGYSGDAPVNMNGTVSRSGAVKVSIRLGEKGANGSGRLSANAGTGTWRDAAANSTCAGRWEAERR